MSAWRSGDLPEEFVEDRASRAAQVDGSYLLARDQAAVERLRQTLPQESTLDALPLDGRA
jgi:hypothetical protein